MAAACILFGVAEVSINAKNGWWLDELFSLWASDRSLPFTRAFVERIAPDSNPPLYYAMLYGVRLFVSNDRAAILVLNVAAVAAAAGAVFIASRRAGLGGLAVGGIAAFALSGPVLCYVAEGRSYCFALSIVFVASWYAALAIEDAQHRGGSASFIVLGALAALTHVYAVLFCGVLAAALIVFAFVSGRKGLIGMGLALGLTTSVVFVLWLYAALGSVTNIGWIEFSGREVFEAATYVRRLAVGGLPALFLLVPLLCFGLIAGATRPLFATFGVAFALFILLPLLGSLKQPIIAGRYWLIGTPALISLMIFAAKDWYLEGRRLRNERTRLIAAGGALLFLCISSIYGYARARDNVASKPIWRGGDIVRPLLDRCPAGSVHIAFGDIRMGGDDHRENPLSLWGFAKVSGAPTSVFVDAELSTTPKISAAALSCPVLGWAEHVLGADFMSRATDSDLIRLLGIEASADVVDVRRWTSGFVVLKRVVH